MLKWQKVLLISLLLVGCKKVFTPAGALSGNSKYLVIEGIINNGDSTFIKLSRTKIFDSIPAINPETNARVNVEGDAGENYALSEPTPGTYSAAPITLNNAHRYRLRIKTTNNEEYISDFVAVKNAPPVDSIGFNALSDGVHIYVNAHDATNATRYYRWEYNEDWQFHSWYESFYIGTTARTLAQYRYQCYAKDVSGAILIASTSKLSQDVVFREPIAAIPPSSEKIETKYSILVKQYALTSDAFSFWENLQKNTNQLGSIFDAQPSENQSNYHCLSNPAELVVGYLSVGSPALKRIFITAAQLLPSYAPKNNYGCMVDTAYYFHAPFYTDPVILGPNSGNGVIDAFFTGPLGPFGLPNHVTYSTTICNDCTLRGVLKPPPFWQ